MAIAFSKTLDSLLTEGRAPPLVLSALLIALQLAAILWAATARIPLYAAAPAQLEIVAGARKIATDAEGRVVETGLALGRRVAEGEVLLRLDARDQELALTRALARLQRLSAELPPLDRQIAHELEAHEASQKSLAASLLEARAQASEAEAREAIGRDELKSKDELFDGGHIGSLELLQARSQVEQRTAAAAALRSARDKLEAEGNAQRAEREAQLAELRKDRAEIDGSLGEARAAVAQAQRELDKRVVRAEVSGRLAEVADVHEGEELAMGKSLATLVPEGQLRVVASFAPGVAMGRIQPGQTGRVRFDGFPWVQYGSLPVRVEQIAREVRGDRVRVELVPLSLQSPIPLQHGLRGTAEVELERVTPMQLFLRLAGQQLAARVQPAPAGESDLMGAR